MQKYLSDLSKKKKAGVKIKGNTDEMYYSDKLDGFQVNKTSNAIRCDVCHKDDLWNQLKEECNRCKDIALIKPNKPNKATKIKNKDSGKYVIDAIKAYKTYRYKIEISSNDLKKASKFAFQLIKFIICLIIYIYLIIRIFEILILKME